MGFLEQSDLPLLPSRSLALPSPVPKSPGVYAWYFRDVPSAVPTSGCITRDGLTLLYVGISPGKRPSTQTLFHRLRYHYQGNAEGSTLRLTLGLLLGLRLRVVGSGTSRYPTETSQV